MSRHRTAATPDDLVALVLRIQQDERAGRGQQQADAARLAEQLGRLSGPPTTETERILWVIDQTDDAPVQQHARQARSALTLVGLIVGVLGLLSGIGIASVVFQYDGRTPVNVIGALGVFVVLQGLMLLLAVVAALPRSVTDVLPGLVGMQEALRLASPGRLALLGSRLLPQDMREALMSAIGRSGAHQRVYGRVQLWAILRWSQIYALAVNLAAVGVFLYLVVVSDLAFSWSTTLDIEPGQFHGLVNGLAVPWFWAEPAQPTEQLVQRSFHYRGTDFDRELSKSWWPFLFAAMLAYGLLPRLVAVVVSSVQLKRATCEALTSTPGALELLRRIERAGDDAESAVAMEEQTTQGDAQGVLGDRPVVIDWSTAAGSSARAAELLGVDPAAYEQAGGARSVQEDRQTLEAIGQRVTRDGVVLLVKLWEPPVIETTTFLQELRTVVGERLPVRVVPIACDTSGRVVGNDPVLAEQWRRRVNAIGDPWLSVAEPVGLTTDVSERTDG